MSQTAERVSSPSGRADADSGGRGRRRRCRYRRGGGSITVVDPVVVGQGMQSDENARRHHGSVHRLLAAVLRRRSFDHHVRTVLLSLPLSRPLSVYNDAVNTMYLQPFFVSVHFSPLLEYCRYRRGRGSITVVDPVVVGQGMQSDENARRHHGSVHRLLAAVLRRRSFDHHIRTVLLSLRLSRPLFVYNDAVNTVHLQPFFVSVHFSPLLEY